MKIRKEMEAVYRRWKKKNSGKPEGKEILRLTEEIGRFLECGGRASEAFRRYLHPKKCRLKADVRAYVVLSVSQLHPLGDDIRFQWNKFYRGENWAFAQEITKMFRIYNPSK